MFHLFVTVLAGMLILHPVRESPMRVWRTRVGPVNVLKKKLGQGMELVSPRVLLAGGSILIEKLANLRAVELNG